MRRRLVRGLLVLAIVGSLAGMLGGGTAANALFACQTVTGPWALCVGAADGFVTAEAAWVNNDNSKAYGAAILCSSVGSNGKRGHYYLVYQTGGNNTFRIVDLGVRNIKCPRLL